MPSPATTITLDRVLLVADGDEAAIGRPLVADASRQRRGPPPGSRREGHLVQVPPEGAPPGQEGPPPGADRPADRRHRARRRRAPRTSAKKAEADAKTERERLEEAAAKQAAADAALAAKLRRPPRPPKPGRGRGDGRGAKRPPRQPRPPSRAAKTQAPTPTAKATTPDGEAPAPRPRRPPRPLPPKTPAAKPRPRRAARHEEGRVDPMAHKKAGSSSKNGRDSVGQRLGVKVGDGQLVTAGSIIVRQRGMTFLAGDGHGARPGLHGLRDRDRQGPVRARRRKTRSASGSRPSEAGRRADA